MEIRLFKPTLFLAVSNFTISCGLSFFCCRMIFPQLNPQRRNLIYMCLHFFLPQNPVGGHGSTQGLVDWLANDEIAEKRTSFKCEGISLSWMIYFQALISRVKTYWNFILYSLPHFLLHPFVLNPPPHPTLPNQVSFSLRIDMKIITCSKVKENLRVVPQLTSVT